MSQKLKLGKYRHHKGEYYEVLGVGCHSETLEEYVFYRALYHSEKFGNHSLWVRPVKMFCEMVNSNGVEKPRFEFIGL